MVDRMGVAMTHRLSNENGVPLASVVRAFVLATSLFDAESLWGEIEALDNKLPTQAQYRFLKMVAGLIKHAMGWIATRAQEQASIEEWIARYHDSAQRLLAELPDFLSGQYHEQWQREQTALVGEGISEPLARRLTSAHNAGGALDILLLDEYSDDDLATTASLYYEVGAWLKLPWLLNAIQALQAEGRWQALARASLRDDCYLAHERIAADVLKQPGDTAKARIKAWRAERGDIVGFVRSRLIELENNDASNFAHLSVAVRDLGRLVKM